MCWSYGSLMTCILGGACAGGSLMICILGGACAGVMIV